VGFNMLQKSLIGPLGAWFLRDVKRAGRPVFAWTVNDEKWMEWCIRKNYRKATRSAAAHSIVVIDGVITDDPKLFGEVCARWEDEVDGKAAPKKLSPLSRFRSALATIRDFFMVQTFGTFFHFQMLYINRRWDFLKNREQYGKDKQ
jgi:phosphatidylglycerol phospholipase C